MDRFAPHLSLALLLGIAWALTSCGQGSVENRAFSSRTSRILEVIAVDSVVADFPVGFASITSGDWQFVGYYNKKRELTIASRKMAEQEWAYHILPTRVGWDSHNRIVMAMDRDHCLHVSGNMHNDSLRYFKTDQPYDISSFRQLFPLVSVADESRCTYPKFIKNAEQALIFSYRLGGSGNGINIANLYDEPSKSFRRLTDQPLFDGLGLMSAYARGPILGPDGWFHLIWFWRDTPGCETNHDLSYARSKDLVQWESLTGEAIPLPITPDLAQLIVDPIPVKGGAINGGAKLFFDANQKPQIAYLKYDSLGKSQIFLARAADSQWERRQLSQWDYRWDFSGPGSIDFEIKVEDCRVGPDGQLLIAYEHIKRGNGELIVDSKSLSLLEDRLISGDKSSPYPAELLRSTSGIDSVEVRWLRVGSSDSDESYALRWESMGQRRYYQAPDIPVRPSVLKLYRFEKNE